MIFSLSVLFQNSSVCQVDMILKTKFLQHQAFRFLRKLLRVKIAFKNHTVDNNSHKIIRGTHT